MSQIEANFPVDKEGRTYHVGTKPGQVANRIITVGDPHRARIVAEYLDVIHFEFLSKRGFLTITGTYKDIPVSIVAIGMGFAMMDFFVREISHVTHGDLVIFRFGSCGGINNATTGNIVIATKSVYIYKDFTSFYNKTPQNGYSIAPVIHASKECVDIIYSELKKGLKKVDIHHGLCATSDSFYSSQGRIGIDFKDKNENVVYDLLSKHPDAEILEMEVYPLYHLADISASKNIKCVACAMVFADRKRNTFLPVDRAAALENEASKSLLDAIIKVKVDLVHDTNAVWLVK